MPGYPCVCNYTLKEELGDRCVVAAVDDVLDLMQHRAGPTPPWGGESDEQQFTQGEEPGDWFAHPSPDGKQIVYLSYDPTVKRHPANEDVTLRMTTLAGEPGKVIVTLFGGQGTINVPSWSPDSTRFVFVSYRLVGK